MNHFESQSCATKFSSSEYKNHSSDEDDGKVTLFSEINELKRCIPKIDEMTDNLDLRMNVDIGSRNLESKQCAFEQDISQLTEKNEHSSSMEATNGNTCNLTSNTSFNIFQHFRFLGVWPSSCPLYVSDDRQEELSDYSNTSSISRSKSDDNESNIMEPNTLDYMEDFATTLHEQGEFQSFTSIITSSKEEYRAVSNVSNRDEVIYTDACLPKSFEKEILYHKNIHITTGNIENSGISREQRDHDVQDLNEGPKNQISSWVVSQASKSRRSEFFDNGEFLNPVNDRNAIVVSSTTDVQRHQNDRRHICRECGKCFRLKQHLVSHHRTHIADKPFACDKCGKRFSRSDILGRHCRTHTAEKPFACNICGRGFSRRYFLVMHLRNHTEEKTYTCSICGKAFPNCSSRNKHCKNVHNMK